MVNAFTSRLSGGNPAGVVLQADGLDSAGMQQVASAIQASETAFVLSPTANSGAHLKLRFFTPTEEVNLCGHAAMSAVSVWWNAHAGDTPQTTLNVETNAGVLPVSVHKQGTLTRVEMGQASPKFRSVQVIFAELGELLGIPETEFDTGLPCAMSYTGLWDLFVPVRSADVLANVVPDLNRIADYTSQRGATSMHVYAMDAVCQENHFHTRDFAPAAGISEDPASGTATGALLSLLLRFQHADYGRWYRFEQGFEMGCPSIVWARSEIRQGRMQVFVAGTAVPMLQKVICL